MMKTFMKRVNSQPEKITMNRKEVSRFLGVSYLGLQRMIDEGGLPYKKFKRMYVFYKPAVEKWLLENNNPASSLQDEE